MRTILAAAVLTATAPLACQQFRPARTAPIPPSIGTQPVLDLATGDLDGDGFDDVVAALDYSGLVHLRADRNGGFVDVTSAVLRPPYSSAYSVSIGDADQDGDLDLAVAHDHAGAVQILLNRGNGTFVDATIPWSPATAIAPIAVEWLDVDSDGALDVYVGDFYGDRLFLQRGGRLVDVTATHLRTRLSGRFGMRVVAMDIDADGDVDVARSGARPGILLLNDGSGHLEAPPPGVLPPANPDLIAIGDFDRDRLVDLVIDDGQAHRLLMQSPNGMFVDRTSTHFANVPFLRYSVAADVDRDGDLDLCSPQHLLVNDGSGRFTDVTATRWTATSGRSAFAGPGYAMGDFDGDGDPDFAIADVASDQLVSVNHDVQVSAPAAPVIGGTYPVDVELRSGYATALAAAVPWYSTGPANVPLPPFGILGVHPSSIIAGPPLLIAAPGGVTRLNLTVPNQPSLIGVTFYLQAVLAESPTALRLSNTLRDRIR